MPRPLNISYEPYAGGFMIADYSDPNNARFCGKDFNWKTQPITPCPFDTEEQAEAQVIEYFTGVR